MMLMHISLSLQVWLDTSAIRRGAFARIFRRLFRFELPLYYAGKLPKKFIIYYFILHYYNLLFIIIDYVAFLI